MPRHPFHRTVPRVIRPLHGRGRLSATAEPGSRSPEPIQDCSARIATAAGCIPACRRIATRATRRIFRGPPIRPMPPPDSPTIARRATRPLDGPAPLLRTPLSRYTAGGTPVYGTPAAIAIPTPATTRYLPVLPVTGRRIPIRVITMFRAMSTTAPTAMRATRTDVRINLNRKCRFMTSIKRRPGNEAFKTRSFPFCKG
jgi:hypothetical protein